MLMVTENPVKDAEDILPRIDRIFLGVAASPSPVDAIKLIKDGKLVLKELKQWASNQEKPTNDLLELIESLGVSIELAEKEIDDEK